MSNGLQISVSQMQGRVPVTVFHIKGAIDASTQQDLQAKAKEAFESGTRDLVLDLSDVSYMASAGFRAIHSIYGMLHADEPKNAPHKPLHLKLLNPSPEVSRIIKTLGFDIYVSTATDLKEAVAAF
jgi:anti-anti-sigma factor